MSKPVVRGPAAYEGRPATWFGAAAEDASGVSSPAQWLSLGLSGGLPPTGAGFAVSPEVALRFCAVFAAVQRISNDIARTPLRLYARSKDGKGREEVDDHPAAARMRRKPASYHTRYTWKRQLLVSMLLFGGAYVWPKVVAPASRRAQRSYSALVPLMANGVLPRILDDQLAYSVVARSQFERLVIGAQSVNLGSDELIRVQGLALNGLEGIALPLVAREAIALGLAMETHNAALFTNGATPGGVLEHPGTLTDPAAQRLRQSWEERHGGSRNSGKVAILEEGMRYNAVSVSNVDAQLQDQRIFQIQEVARVYNIPPHKLGDYSHAKYANIEHAELDYFSSTLSPWFELICAALDEGLLTDAESKRYFFGFDIRHLVRGDFATRATAILNLRNGAVISANEAREDLGWNPSSDPKADELTTGGRPLPVGGQGTSGAPPAPDGTPTPGEDGPPGARLRLDAEMEPMGNA